MAHRVSVRNQKDEITGSSRALQNGFSSREDSPKKELGTAAFLHIDTRPNGRHLHKVKIADCRMENEREDHGLGYARENAAGPLPL